MLVCFATFWFVCWVMFVICFGVGLVGVTLVCLLWCLLLLFTFNLFGVAVFVCWAWLLCLTFEVGALGIVWMSSMVLHFCFVCFFRLVFCFGW